MEFDLTASVVTIGPLEPTLLVSVVVALLLAWPAGTALGALTVRVTDPWRRLIYLGPVWLLAGVLLFALPDLLLNAAFPAMHPEYRGAFICVALVWPLFLLVPLLGLVAAVVRVRRRRVAVGGAKAT